MLSSSEPFPIAAAAERRLDRRRFLRAAGSAAVLAACGNAWGARQLEEARDDRLAVRLAVADHPPIGQSRTVADDAGREALVVRLEDATVVAFDRRCPHLGCPVVWAADRDRFECPCHHAAFDARTGRVLFGPPRRGLALADLTIA